MSTDEEPLHVAVARALGWTDIHPRTGGHWWGREPHGGLTITVPRYDTSWCSVGPLVERFGISVGQSHLLNEELTPSGWVAMRSDAGSTSKHTIQDGKTPCEAIARLIVELSRTGKLPK